MFISNYEPSHSLVMEDAASQSFSDAVLQVTQEVNSYSLCWENNKNKSLFFVVDLLDY